MHTHFVRDVAWAPCIGLGTSTIATCAHNGVVAIWTRSADGDDWHLAEELEGFKSANPENAPVWSLSWSLTSSILAVSWGVNKGWLFKESVERKWVRISELEGE